MVSYSILSLILIPALTLTLLSIGSASTSFAQETTERYLIARVEIWALFYRLMVIAFVIGAVVMGTITYVVWRFRESHPKNRGSITPAAGGGKH
ncbi:MAG TPA: heme transporter CcmC [Nitrososphaera sp.]|jgi:heme/copper-type cytochrome/quinol oxidase subunit 2|nr:heme transporter CcmC [Nitrososphaera sp.]